MQRAIHLKENKDTLSLLIGEKKLNLHHGDITSLVADAIVCPARDSSWASCASVRPPFSFLICSI